MSYCFDRITSREGTSCLKYDKRKEVFGSADVIPMWIADMDFEVPPFICEAIHGRLNHPVLGYDFRCEYFDAALQGWLHRRNGWDIETSWVNCTPGVVAGIVFGLQAFSREDDGVVIQPPVYPPFANAIRANGRRVITNPLRYNGKHFEIDFEDLDEKLKDSKIFLLCNPHNPTGRVFSRDELLEIGRLCEKHNVVIISDEIHSDFTYAPFAHTHIASLNNDLSNRTITLIAPSKTFNIAGLSTSAAIIANDNLRAQYEIPIERMHVSGGNTFGNIAFEVAYSKGDEWVDELKIYLKGNIDFATDYLRKNIPSISFAQPEGTFLLWLDFSQWGIAHHDIMKFLTDKAGIGLNDGREFGSEGWHCARMNLGAPRAIIEKALKQLHQAYEGHFNTAVANPLSEAI